MKSNHFHLKNKLSKPLFVLLSLFFGFQASAEIRPIVQLQDSIVNIFSGVITGENREKLPYAALSVEKTNISTVANADGEFLIKVPKTDMDKNLLISFLGYENIHTPLTSLQPVGNKIMMIPLPFTLPELEVISKDPDQIIRKMMENKNKNYSLKDMMMTAFYRETIKKTNTNISLSEAIVEVYKRSYNSSLHDMASLYKSRKSTDYHKLDTLVFKLMGGPFNNIYLDVMRYPDYIFTDNIFDNYEFKFVKTDQINERTVYVISFKQFRHIVEPLFYGNLYIDAESYALAKAEFDMDLVNNDEATLMFVRKKPINAKVNTTKAHYVVDYRLVDGLWYYSYSRIDLGLKINWKRRLFHSFYNSSIEMAATDWSDDVDRKTFRTKERISPTVIIHDEASGFADPAFWGEYNIIEPDKSIDNAIKKIQKQLKRN
ncbi:MAG: carboxypeptidase-like regulatory domain-containing protein [Paludibacteraceae bacterium]